MRGLQEPVLLDEWQATPGAFAATKRAIDAHPSPNRFYLTGSVTADLGREVWPGTGRLVRVPMYPMTVRERIGSVDAKPFLDRVADGDPFTVPDDTPDLRGYVDLAMESGFPTAALELAGRPKRRWLESYIDDLLTRDVESLDGPGARSRDANLLRRYFEAYALNSAGTADHETIHDAAGVSRVTANEYESLLTRMLIVEQLPAWTTNRLKRLVRTPKRYVIDAALVCAALRLSADGVLADGDLLGRILDTFVVAQLRPETVVADTQPRLHHVRTEGGRREIDLVAELGGQRIIGIEIKARAAPTDHDARHLRWLKAELGERFVRGVVLHTGPRAYDLADGITAAPISAIWADDGQPIRSSSR